MGAQREVQPPTAAELEELLAIRAQLDEARLSAKSSAPPWVARRAVIMLDATVEHAMRYVGHREAIPIKGGADGKWDDAYSAVKQSLLGWDFAMRSDVRSLHGARNLAQHEGVPPDRMQLPKWANAADAFVRSIVLAAFGVEIDKLALSRVLEHPELRAMFEAAEQAIASDDAASAVHSSFEAFGRARELWAQARAHGRPSRHPFRDLRSPLHDTEREIDAISAQAQYISDVMAFGDIGEYEWLVRVVRDATDRYGDSVPTTEPTIDEARRALSFAFWWALRSEAAREALDVDRANRAIIEGRPTRASLDLPTRIVGVTVGPGRVMFALADVPAPDEFEAWSATLKRDLRTRAGGRDPDTGLWWDWFLRDDSIVRATQFEPDPRKRNSWRSVRELDASAAPVVTETLRDALAVADASIGERHAERAARRADTAARRQEYRDAVAALGFNWIADVHTFGAHADRVDNDDEGLRGVRVDFTGDAFPGVAGRGRAAQEVLADQLRSKYHQVSKWPTGDWLEVEGQTAPNDLAAALRVVHQVMRHKVAAAEATSAEGVSRRADVQAAFYAAVQKLG